MTLLILLIALGVQWFMGQRISREEFNWFDPYVNFLSRQLQKTELLQGYIGLAIVVVPIVLLVLIVNLIIDDVFLSIIEFFFGLVVFFYCVDATDPAASLASYFKGNKAEKEVKAYVGSTLPKTDGGVARKVSQTILVHALHHIFSLIFWFVILGPVGVITVFMVHLVATTTNKQLKPMAEAANIVQGVLDWVPVRLVGLSFALMGSFADVFMYWIKHIANGIESAEELLSHYGLLANGANPRDSKASTEQEPMAIAALVYRALIVWVVVIAVISISSWF